MGGGSNRCVYLTNSTTLSGFTLTNGGKSGGVFCESPNAVVSNSLIAGNWAFGGGGGAFGGTLNNCTLSNNGAAGWRDADFSSGGGAERCTLNNCTLVGNQAIEGGGANFCTLNNCTLAENGARFGAGASSSALNNCVLRANVAENSGGGAYIGTLNNCTLVGNIAHYGGGAYLATLHNCIVYFNDAPDGANYDSRSVPSYCCTMPLPTNGVGNITSDPLFVDTNGWTNLRLQPISPCINAGNNAYVVGSTDFDGNPRIAGAGGTVDIGAYEFQAPVSQISYAWLYQHGLPINASTDSADPDADGVDNYHEWLAGSDPTYPFSFPPLLSLIPFGANIILTWPTNAVGFAVLSTTNLNSPVVWTTNSPAPIVIGGQNVVINPVSSPQQFYRLVH